jgi:hypothetical protein
VDQDDDEEMEDWEDWEDGEEGEGYDIEGIDESNGDGETETSAYSPGETWSD